MSVRLGVSVMRMRARKERGSKDEEYDEDTRQIQRNE